MLTIIITCFLLINTAVQEFQHLVGTSGFSTSKNIKEATVMFRVESTWIDGNTLARSEIKLIKWDNGKWITFETSEKKRDGTYTYFEGKFLYRVP